MGATSVVASLGGAARLSALRARGVTRHMALAAAGRGELERPATGVYSVPGAPEAVALAAEMSARLTCVSALEVLGASLLEPPDALHIASASGGVARRRGSPVRLHRDLRMRDTSLGTVVPAAIALEHAARCCDRINLVVAADSALHRGLLSRRQLAELRVNAWAREVLLRDTDARAESVVETLARIEISDGGMEVWPQARIPGVGRVDLLVDGELVVEIDGRAYHSDERAFSADRGRDRELLRRGYRVARFPAAEALRRDGSIARAVHRLARHPEPAVRVAPGRESRGRSVER